LIFFFPLKVFFSLAVIEAIHHLLQINLVNVQERRHTHAHAQTQSTYNQLNGLSQTGTVCLQHLRPFDTTVEHIKVMTNEKDGNFHPSIEEGKALSVRANH